MRMPMRRKKPRKPMMDQHRMWRTEGIEGLTWDAVMSTGMSERMVTMRLRMSRNTHRKPKMDQRRMWRTKGLVRESVNIRLSISDV